MEKYDEFFQSLVCFSEPGTNEPDKMVTYKKTLRENIEKYLACLKDPAIPMTNNMAEQSLRHKASGNQEKDIFWFPKRENCPCAGYTSFRTYVPEAEIRGKLLYGVFEGVRGYILL